MGRSNRLENPNAIHTLDGNAWRRARLLDIERHLRQNNAHVIGEAQRLVDAAIKEATTPAEQSQWTHYRDIYLREALDQYKRALKSITAVSDVVRSIAGKG